MPIIKLPSKKYSDAAIVDGVYRRKEKENKRHNQKMGDALYELCREYYEENFRAVFLVDDESEEDIFQNSLETLLEKIDNRKIYAQDKILIGKDGKPLTCTLTTYFMGIAKLKYKEWVRKHPIGDGKDKKPEDISDKKSYKDILYDDDEKAMESIIADCISKMSERCSRILTLFYYEERSLSEILEIIPSDKNRDALKMEKYRCMKTLRESANEIYRRLFI